MAAAILKILTRWLEHQLAGSSPVKPLVAQALQKIAQDALPRSERQWKESGQSSIPGVVWGIAAAAWPLQPLQHVAQEALLHANAADWQVSTLRSGVYRTVAPCPAHRTADEGQHGGINAAGCRHNVTIVLLHEGCQEQL